MNENNFHIVTGLKQNADFLSNNGNLNALKRTCPKNREGPTEVMKISVTSCN